MPRARSSRQSRSRPLNSISRRPSSSAIPRPSNWPTRLADLAPGDLNYAFFCNSGSEAADTALKIALAYQRMKGQASRTRLIGRERGYHGVNFGGISVGGMAGNRKMFGAMIAGVDHLPHTYNRAEQALHQGRAQMGCASGR